MLVLDVADLEEVMEDVFHLANFQIQAPSLFIGYANCYSTKKENKQSKFYIVGWGDMYKVRSADLRRERFIRSVSTPQVSLN